MTTYHFRSDADVKDTLRQFIIRSINLPELADDDDLFESGLVTSLFAIQLMTFIEKTYGIEVDSDDLDIDNFRSLNSASAFVLKKSTANAS